VRLLLDTHAFLWWISADERLSRRASRAIAARENECLVSIASAWEVAIKASLGKLEVPEPLERFLADQLAANGFRLLGLELRHVAGVRALPFHHRDPFDRLLASQCLAERLMLVSADPVFRRYGVRRIW
jgi:PIN domain nuclease of toxin-antitoxin system